VSIFQYFLSNYRSINVEYKVTNLFILDICLFKRI
jgi:hypothetical protein